jgi:hypothetical protein
MIEAGQPAAKGLQGAHVGRVAALDMRRRTKQMTNSEYLTLQLGIICALLFLVGVTAVTEHPEWFG